MTTKALAAWRELNDRQQGTLSVIYELEQGVEVARKVDAANGYWDSSPAAVWRRIDFAHDPSDRRLFGTTELQSRLASRGWDNQGNGSTMAALADRGLITLDQRGTTFGLMRTVTLTRAGRAAVRAGTALTTGRAPKAALGQRAWEVLAKLWACDQAGKPLDWGHSTTIDRVLIGKHVPPLARKLDWRGYEITDRGREFYGEHYAAHTVAHPDVPRTPTAPTPNPGHPTRTTSSPSTSTTTVRCAQPGAPPSTRSTPPTRKAPPHRHRRTRTSPPRSRSSSPPGTPCGRTPPGSAHSSPPTTPPRSTSAACGRRVPTPQRH